MINKRFWLILLMVFVSLGTIFIFWSTLHQAVVQKNADSNINTQSLGNSDEFEKMKIKIPGSDKDGYWELNVKKLVSLEDFGKLESIEGDYYVKKKLVYRLNGDNGLIIWKDKIFKVTGHVKLKTMDNRTKLSANQMIWDPHKQGISIQHQAMLQTDNFTITADAIQSDLNFKQISFIGLTKAVYKRVNLD